MSDVSSVSAAIVPTTAPADVGALIGRLQSRTATVGVIGLGYVGLPLAVEFADAGLQVVPVDVDRFKVDSIAAAGLTFPMSPATACADW